VEDLSWRLASVLERFLAGIPQAVLALDPQGRVLFVNPSAARILDAPAGELAGRTLEEVWPGLDRALRERLPGTLAGVDGIPVARDVSGEFRTFLALEDPLPSEDGTIVGTAVWLLAPPAPDALVRENLRLRDQFRTLTDQSTDVIFVLARDLRVEYVNPALRMVLGVEPEEVVGRPLDLQAFLPPDEIRRLRLLGTHRILREGIRNKLVRVLTKSGSTFWGLLTVAPSQTSRRSSTFLGILRDVSEFYRTREQLVRHHAQLKKTVAQLEEANRLQEQFVANVTHELRTPLTTILISAEALERGADPLSPVQGRHLEILHRNARQLLDIIGDMLDLAKLKRAAFTVKERPVEVAAFFTALLDESEPLFAQKGLRLDRKISPDLPPVAWTDPELLRKVLLNLLSNAAKFTREGGAAFAANASDGHLRVEVSDTGRGIPAEEVGRIFEEFRQVDGSDSRRHPGTGLGLSIADRCARLLDGTISVESTPGMGSRFTVVLPLREVPPPPIAPGIDD
jgi:PAS domain S-box-containing protein